MVGCLIACSGCVETRGSSSLRLVFSVNPSHCPRLVLSGSPQRPSCQLLQSSDKAECCLQFEQEGLQAVMMLLPLLTDATISQRMQLLFLHSALWLVNCAKGGRAVTSLNLDDGSEESLYDGAEIPASAKLHRNMTLTACAQIVLSCSHINTNISNCLYCV